MGIGFEVGFGGRRIGGGQSREDREVVNGVEVEAELEIDCLGP